MTFTQDFTSLAYNVTVVAQADSYGYGPAYLLNGLSSAGYWYQVGVSYNWPNLAGGYVAGFSMIYEVFNKNGTSIFPSSGGGLLTFSGPVSSGDKVLLGLYFSGGNVIMNARDWNTGASASQSYSAQSATYFTGSPSSASNSKGFFTGLMTEKYYVSPYFGNIQEVDYVDRAFALSSAWMWIDEFNSQNKSQVLFSAATPAPIQYTTPTQMHPFSSNGATEYSSAYEFITGALGKVSLTVSYSVQGGGVGYSPPTLTYSSNAVIQTAVLNTSPLNFNVDSGSNWSINGLLQGSTSNERWQTNQPTTASASFSQTISLVYYHQFLVTLGFNVAGGGSGYSPPTVAYTQFGFGTSTTAGSGVWVDVGSAFSYPSLLTGGSSTERWQTNQQVSGQVISSQPLNVQYYHQFLVSFNFNVVGGGTGYSPPSVSYSQFGVTLTTGIGTSIWTDAQSTYTFQNQLPGSTGIERWFSSTASGSVASSGQVLASYNHQNLLTVIGAGSISQWYNSGSADVFTTAGVFARQSGTGSRIVSYSLDGAPVVLTSPTTGNVAVPVVMNTSHTLVFSSVTQYQVNLDSGALQALYSATPPTIGGDNYWYDQGTHASVNLNGVWGRSGNAGNRLVSYSVNAGPATNVASNGEVTVLELPSIGSPQTVTTIVSKQYELRAIGGSGISFSISSPISKDTGWYDTGTTLRVSTVVHYNESNGARLRVNSWNLDNGPASSVQANDTFTSSSIVMDGPHVANFNSITQYLFNFSFFNHSGTNRITPSAFTIGIENGVESKINETAYWFDDGSRVAVNSIAWEGADVKPSSLSFLVSSPNNVRISTLVYPLNILLTDPLGLPVSGALAKVSLANNTVVSVQSRPDGTFEVGLIPLGRFTATVSNLGISTQIAGDAASRADFRATVTLSYSVLGVSAAAISAAIVTAYALVRRTRGRARASERA